MQKPLCEEYEEEPLSQQINHYTLTAQDAPKEFQLIHIFSNSSWNHRMLLMLLNRDVQNGLQLSVTPQVINEQQLLSQPRMQKYRFFSIEAEITRLEVDRPRRVLA